MECIICSEKIKHGKICVTCHNFLYDHKKITSHEKIMDALARKQEVLKKALDEQELKRLFREYLNNFDFDKLGKIVF